MSIQRCAWVNLNDPLYCEYHDQEWGVPVHDDRLLFEFLLLEGFQAGLSWSTILHKRENFRLAFNNFAPEMVAEFDEARVQELLTNPGIIRNQLKIRAAILNAQAFLKVKAVFGSFDLYLWQFVDGRTIQNQWRSLNEIPVRTVQSDQMSKDLKQRGFKFVGSTICYAHMQATGMVNDHTMDCFRYEIISAM